MNSGGMASTPSPEQPDTDRGQQAQDEGGGFGNDAATAAVTGTAAIALRLMGRTDGIEDAEAQARALWENRAGSPLDVKDAA